METAAGFCIVNRNRLNCLAFAASDSTLIYAEFLGPVALGKALRAILREAMAEASRKRSGSHVYTDVAVKSYTSPYSGKINLNTDPYYLFERRVKEGARGSTDHWCIMAHELTKFATQRKYVLAGTADQKSPWFAAALRDYTVPVHMTWYDLLWRKAINAKILTPVEVSLGPKVWQLSKDESWTTKVRQWTLSKDLTLPASKEEQDGTV